MGTGIYANAFLAGTGADTWLVVGTGMEPNTAKSTGGYVSYTAG